MDKLHPTTPYYTHISDDHWMIIKGLLEENDCEDIAKELGNNRVRDDHELAYVAAAKHQSEDNHIEVDDFALVSEGEDNGAYVLAWLWVDNEEVPNEVRELYNFHDFRVSPDDVIEQYPGTSIEQAQAAIEHAKEVGANNRVEYNNLIMEYLKSNDL